MAKAEVRTVIEPKPVKLKRIVLELTMVEARTLVTLFEKIGGSPQTTLRGKIDSMYSELRSAGVEAYHLFGYDEHDKWCNEDERLVPLHVTGNSLYFDEGSVSYIQPGEDE